MATGRRHLNTTKYFNKAIELLVFIGSIGIICNILMLITLTRTGGFTGIPFKKTIDTTKLPQENAKEIEGLVSNIQINEYTNKQISSPDRFIYTLSIQDETISQEVHFSETSLTQPMKELIQKLETM